MKGKPANIYELCTGFICLFCLSIIYMYVYMLIVRVNCTDLTPLCELRSLLNLSRLLPHRDSALARHGSPCTYMFNLPMMAESLTRSSSEPDAVFYSTLPVRSYIYLIWFV